jgi:hypothetical protein
MTTDKYVTEANPLIDDRMPMGKRVMTVKFPCLIKQVDRDTVEIELEPGPDPFNEKYTGAVVERMGVYAGEAFLEEMTLYLARQMVLRNVR